MIKVRNIFVKWGKKFFLKIIYNCCLDGILLFELKWIKNICVYRVSNDYG